MTKKLFTLLFTSLLLVSIFNITTSSGANSSNQIMISFTTSEPVEILNDTALASYSTSGSGIPSDPYILDGLNISTSAEVGLTIKGTTSYFVLQNSWITSGGLIDHQVFNAINLEEIASGTAVIRNNTCYNSYNGIYVRATDNITLVGNKCYDNFNYGVYSYFASNVSLISNFAYNNSRGFYISYSSDTLVINNTLLDNSYGINLYQSDSSKLVNNTCIDHSQTGFVISGSLYAEVYGNYLRNDDDISIRDSDNSTIYYNQFEGKNTGIYISSTQISVFNNSFVNHNEYSIGLSTAAKTVIKNNNMSRGITILDDSLNVEYHYIMDNNTIGNLPIGYFENERDLVIGNEYAQIIVVKSTNITVTNGRFTNVSNGISFYFSNNSFLINNHCNYSSEGIHVSFSNNMTIVNNTCNNNFWVGIVALTSPNATIQDNVILDNFFSGLVVSNAALFHETKIINNTIVGGGLMISDSNYRYENYFLENNTVNELPYGYFVDIENLIIDEKYGQIFIYNAYNVTIKNQNLSNQQTSLYLLNGELIEVTNCTFSDVWFMAIGMNADGVTLRNNTFERNGMTISIGGTGLLIDDNLFNQNYIGVNTGVASSIISNNVFVNNTIGIDLFYASNGQIKDNFFNNNSQGIKLISSSNSQIEANEFAFNEVGITVDSSDNTLITNNFFWGDEKGIVIEDSNYCHLVNNGFNNSESNALTLTFSSSYCTIDYNYFHNSESYAVVINWGSNENSIYDNFFIDNNVNGTSQACDNGTSNLWYNDQTLTGNYWSDYSGTGGYQIDGTAGTLDLYPYEEPTIMELPQNAIIYLTFAGIMVNVRRKKK